MSTGQRLVTEAVAAFAALDEWEAAGRPGTVSHEEFMAEILGTASSEDGDPSTQSTFT